MLHGLVGQDIFFTASTYSLSIVPLYLLMATGLVGAIVGFVLLGLVAGGPDGVASVMLYLLIYVFMNLGIFAIIIMMRSGNVSGEAIED